MAVLVAWLVDEGLRLSIASHSRRVDKEVIPFIPFLRVAQKKVNFLGNVAKRRPYRGWGTP